MKERTGEKGGWIGGWVGSFLWLLLFGIVRLYQGQTGPGLLAIGLFALALVVIVRFAPWNNPETRYWKLLGPVYLLFLIALVSVIWTAGGPNALGLGSWSFLWLIPFFVPFLTIGNRRWKD